MKNKPNKFTYIDKHNLLGSNFYWHKGIELGFSKEDLKRVELFNDRVLIHKDLIKPLLKANKTLKEKGYSIYITEGYRSKELYKEVSKKIGKNNTNKILNMNDMPHVTGKSVDIVLWKDNKKLILHDREDGFDGYFFGFYKDKNEKYHKLQEMLINTMQENGFELGKKKEYFHFNYSK